MKKKDEGYFSGPFDVIFGNPVAKVLDQSLLVGGMEQTTSMLAESTGLSFKTVQTAVDKLVALGFMRQTRKIGNAQAYRFEVEKDLHELLECAQNLQIQRLKSTVDK